MGLEIKKKELRKNYTVYWVPDDDRYKAIFGGKNSSHLYCAGVYGWDFDVWLYSGTAIVSGYRPIGERVPQKLLDEYADKMDTVKAMNNYNQYSREYVQSQQLIMRDFFRALWKEVRKYGN